MTKITALDPITSPDELDVFVIDDVSAPESKKITFANLRAALGLDDLEAAVTAGVPAALFEWNGVDVSQFDAVRTYRNDGNSAPAGVASLSVVDAPYGTDKKALRLTGSALFQGGAFFAITGLTLPTRYVVTYRILTHNAPVQGIFAFLLFGKHDGTIARGLTHARSLTSSNNSAGMISNNQQESQTNLTGTVGSLDATARARGGERHHFEVWRQAGENPAQKWYVYGTCLNQLGGDASAGHASGGHTYASLPPIPATDWDGHDMTLIGPGLYNSGAAAAITVDISDLKIWEWPGPRGY